ncbi:MAG TPA: hypothetical protein PKV41_03615, partial [Candidatus Omnitrophota bacterium]|nr:hypothetical protein [Candidatus Omnitrophota bacterium]
MSVERDQNIPTKAFAFILGATSMIGQVLLLREMVTVFYGNEMAYAVILASWLFWIAFGSYAASAIALRIKRPALWISALQGAVFLILPVTIIAARHVKEALRLQPGEIPGILPMAGSAFVLLAPLAVVLGGLFTLICLAYEPGRKGGVPSHGISEIYLWESFGAAAGGAIFSFLLVRLLPAMHLAFAVALVNLALGPVLDRRGERFFMMKMALIVAGIAFILSGSVGKIDRWTRAKQWKGLDVIVSTDSIYGNIAMMRIGSEYNLYENGMFSYATSDELTSEESVHFPLLEHPRPRRVLLIGNGMGGSLREILKHPVEQVDYVELDPKIIEISMKYLPPAELKPLEDGRVQVFYADARWFVKRAGHRYDAAILNLADPHTALVNRYYSLEFFREISAVLEPGGILALGVSSSENYLNEEAKDLLRSVHTTLRRVFADVKSIPGDRNIFLASRSSGVLTYDARILIGRLQERRIDAKYVREYYLPFRLSADRISYIQNVLREEGDLNTDERPIAYLYNIVLWSTRFNTGFKNLFIKLRAIPPSFFFLLPAFIFMGGWWGKKFSPTAPITVSIATTGFSEIIFQLVVILGFQALYGYAYYRIGWIMASFMAGLCLGTIRARGIMAR